MKHRFVFSLFVFVASLFVFILPLFANGAADYYAVTISKFELNNGTAWITVFEGTSSELDIASVGSGASAGNFLSGIVVPDGTYTQARVTPSPTFKIRGTDGAGKYTTAANAGDGGSITTADINLKATCTITLTGANVPKVSDPADFTATPITVTNGVANRKVRVTFDVSNAVQLQGGELWPAQPTVTLSVQ